MVASNETLLDAIDLVRPGFRVLIFDAQKMQLIPNETCQKQGVGLVYPEPWSIRRTTSTTGTRRSI